MRFGRGPRGCAVVQGWGRGTPPKSRGSSGWRRGGVAESGGPAGRPGAGGLKGGRLRGRQRARSPGHEAPGRGRSGQGRRWRGFILGVPDKGVTVRGRRGDKGSSLKMGVGGTLESSSGSRKLGSQEASEPREPSRRHGGPPQGCGWEGKG